MDVNSEKVATVLLGTFAFFVVMASLYTVVSPCSSSTCDSAVTGSAVEADDSKADTKVDGADTKVDAADSKADDANMVSGSALSADGSVQSTSVSKRGQDLRNYRRQIRELSGQAATEDMVSGSSLSIKADEDRVQKALRLSADANKGDDKAAAEFEALLNEDSDSEDGDNHNHHDRTNGGFAQSMVMSDEDEKNFRDAFKHRTPAGFFDSPEEEQKRRRRAEKLATLIEENPDQEFEIRRAIGTDMVHRPTFAKVNQVRARMREWVENSTIRTEMEENDGAHKSRNQPVPMNAIMSR